MADLKGSKTEQNLKDAFAGESQANRRYLYFAQKEHRYRLWAMQHPSLWKLPREWETTKKCYPLQF